MFNFHQKREFNDVSREPAYILNKYQSVKNLRGMKVHSGQYCFNWAQDQASFQMKFFMPSLTFNILSRKCSNEKTFGIESLQ